MSISPPALGVTRGRDQDTCSLTHLQKAGLDMAINVAPTFDVGDRVTGAVGSSKSEKATVVGTARCWVKVRMDERPEDVRYYLPSDLVHLTKTESDLSFADAEDTITNTETDIRVVASFHRPEVRDLTLLFTDASEADTWITYLKGAPGRTTVTVMYNTTNVFTRNDD